MIDIVEDELMNMSEKLFNMLLKDRTTRKNICWATDHYVMFGNAYYPQEPITKELVTGKNAHIISPRVAKTLREQSKRTKEKAEVFTPSWVCNEQNNLIDEAWFGRKDVFNQIINQSWITNKKNIVFPQNKSWRKYVDAKRLEISCGEAPYLVSRYDTVSGLEIPLEDRIGLLDRKLRIVNENTVSESDWFEWVKRAYESIYGYEYQGDSLLIARENLLYTFIENMEYKFSHKPSEDQLLTIAKIISWNLWQMDGITMNAPYSERDRVNTQLSIFDFFDNDEISEKEPIPCKIYDWRANTSLEFRSMMNGGDK
ncbi:restriction endonuclease subunit M [Thomasclavelia saccharogumia]|uniref:restriction endonuclease subunit M n=1 Tax=Thomasclavelia saccharogumia TaxID=341225 RepID=UPI000A672672|nr:restriction endonuclease subunit M [Thomasclavelia saccharogumia]